jgi:tetratricopeptide (TPR) repeat protein
MSPAVRQVLDQLQQRQLSDEQRQLVAAVTANPAEATALHQIGLTLISDIVVRWTDSNRALEQQLFAAAVEADPSNAAAHADLARTLAKSSDSFTFADGRVQTARELLLRAVALAPRSAHCLQSLARILERGETVEVKNSQGAVLMMSAQELLLDAIQHDPTHALSYNNLAAHSGTWAEHHSPRRPHYDQAAAVPRGHPPQRQVLRRVCQSWQHTGSGGEHHAARRPRHDPAAAVW